LEKVHLIARLVAREGMESELKSVLYGMLEPTHAEPGCEVYDLYESNQAGVFIFNEIWESQDALQKHLASAHFKQLEEALTGLLEVPAELNIVKPVK
jgi:quinol monooxygenase YgiN